MDRNGPSNENQDLSISESVSPDTAMLFVPFGCTHPLPLSHLFCSHRINLSPKDIPRSDMMKQKVSQHYMKSLGRKDVNKLLYMHSGTANWHQVTSAIIKSIS